MERDFDEIRIINSIRIKHCSSGEDYDLLRGWIEWENCALLRSQIEFTLSIELICRFLVYFYLSLFGH